MITVKGIKPMYSGIITEFKCYENDMRDSKTKLIVAVKGQPMDYQKVIAVGDSGSNINVGDYVKVHYKNFMKLQHGANSLINDTDVENKKVSFNPPVIDVNNKPALLLRVADIEFACEELFEDGLEVVEPETESSLIIPKKSIIDPTKGNKIAPKKKIILP